MNRKAKKAMAMGMAALVAVTSVGGNTAEAAVKKLTKKATVTKSLTVKVGKTKKISVKKVPKKTKVTYKTNKKKIATVTKKGVVKGVKKGKAVITVKLKYKKKTITKKCNVTVKKATTTKVTATATPTVPAQVPTATPVAPVATATPGTNATATPGTNATETPGANATETPGADAPTPTTPGAVTPSETPSTTPDETETPEVVTKAAMTFTKDMAYGALKANNKVYVISQEAVKEVKDGAKEIEYTVIDLTTGKKEIEEAEIEEDVTFDEFTFDNEFTCSVDENTKTVTVVSETTDIKFVAYNTYSKANTEATLVDSNDKYVITYAELYKAYKADKAEDVTVSYTKNGKKETTTVKGAGEEACLEVTVDSIVCKAFVNTTDKTADVIVLKSDVVLK